MLPPFVCKRAHVLFTLFVFVRVQHRLCCVFLRLVYLMLTVSLDCPFLIVPSIFSNVYFKLKYICQLYLSILYIFCILSTTDTSQFLLSVVQVLRKGCPLCERDMYANTTLNFSQSDMFQFLPGISNRHAWRSYMSLTMPICPSTNFVQT